MSATGSIVIYVIIWRIVFFSLLPIDVNRIKNRKIEGEDPGSPENPKIFKKFVYTSIISSILFLIIYYLVNYNYLNLRNFLM